MRLRLIMFLARGYYRLARPPRPAERPARPRPRPELRPELDLTVSG